MEGRRISIGRVKDGRAGVGIGRVARTRRPYQRMSFQGRRKMTGRISRRMKVRPGFVGFAGHPRRN
jgi:hypothetical protein